MAGYDLHVRAAAIVRDAGGKLVGRTRLQKITYLSQLAGFADDFPFEYRHYGPFSDDLAEAMEIATGLRLVEEDEQGTGWGGWYSTYRFNPSNTLVAPTASGRAHFVSAAAKIGAIELELAATAAFLYADEGIGREDERDPWKETARRKPEKASGGRLRRAKAAYRKLQAIASPRPLPQIG